MISGNIEKFNSPIRQITGKVELLGKGSTPTNLSGNPLEIDDAVPGSVIDIQLTSDTITDFSNVGTKYGKNLLKLDGREPLTSYSVLSPTSKYNLNGNRVLIGFAASGYLNSAKIKGYSITENTVSFTSTEHAYGIGFDVRVKPNTAYTLTADDNVNLTFYVAHYDSEGMFISFTAKGKFTTPSNAAYAVLVVRVNTEANVELTVTNLQLEYGTTATVYEPYYEEPIPVEIVRLGRNLAKYDSLSCNVIVGNGTANTGLILTDLCPHIELNKPYVFTADVNGDGLSKMRFRYDDSNGNQVYYYDYNLGTPITFGKETDLQCKVRLYANSNITDRARNVVFTNMTITPGNTAAAYEPYTELVVAANSEGTLSIPSLLGTNRLFSSSDVILNITYQKSLSANNAVFPHDGDLIRFAVDKTGESKFFGYGVCQKIEVEIRDKDRQYNPSTDNYLQVSLDDKVAFPLFYVSDVKRNENTNGLTITAYDLIAEASKHTFNELSITNYSLDTIASAIGTLLGACNVITDYYFEVDYTDFLNVDGSETLREVLDDLAEATQTIYYVNYLNELVFKRLDIKGSPVYTIDKAQYFTLNSEASKTLTTIIAATELGDNVSASSGEGEAQVVRDNIFWTSSADVGEEVERALVDTAELTITPFNCLWRGNYLLEIGDKIGLIGKDDEIISTYFLNDKLTYSGGMKQNTQWTYKANEAPSANPSTLGEVLKQTYAKVDKANKQIVMVVSETSANKAAISSLQQTTSSITATVSSMEQTASSLSDEVSELAKQVELAITDEDVEIKIKSELANGVDKVKTTEKNFTFDDEGLSISSSESNISTTITEDGMTVKMNDNEVLTANNEGVKAIDLHATTYLIIGKNSRFEDYGNRTACFWIGG